MSKKNGYETLRLLVLELHRENKSDIKEIRTDIRQIKSNDLQHLRTQVTEISTRNKIYGIIFGGLISLASVVIMAIKIFM